MIALEPEAASLFCMHIPVDHLQMTGAALSQSQMSPFAQGTRYMVVDVGGIVNINIIIEKSHGKNRFMV